MANKLTTEEFKKRASEVHNTKYSYDKSIYINGRSDIIITCPVHNDYVQNARSHLRGYGCIKCDHDKKRSSKEEFIDSAVRIHGDLYDYSLVEYIQRHQKIDVICKVHGIFSKTVVNHISNEQGCPFCVNPVNSRGEYKIRKILETLGIAAFNQYKFSDCRDERELPFDFFIPSMNMLIEYDGIQHFKPVKYFGGLRGYLDRIRKDAIKTKYAESNNIRLIRIPYTKFDKIDLILYEMR